VILSDDFSPLDGGIATWAAAVAGGLHAAGHEVLVFARFRDGLGLDEAGRPLPYEGGGGLPLPPGVGSARVTWCWPPPGTLLPTW